MPSDEALVSATPAEPVAARIQSPDARWPLYLLGLVHGLVISTILFDYLSPLHQGAIVADLTPAERLAGIVRTEPTTAPIIVRFLPSAAIKQANGPTTHAFTSAYRDLSGPCRVTLPTGMKIAFESSAHAAYFLDGRDADTVAHELLHCLRWNWHAD